MVKGYDETGPRGHEDEGNPVASAISERDRDIQSMVRRSLDRKDVLLAYQPVVSARDTSSMAFFEGLLRVLDDTGRIIPAAEFIGACETTETGRILDCLALEAGLQALARAPALRLAINMSARSIGYSRWMRTLRSGLDEAPMVAERRIIEISESSTILMPDITMAFVQELQTIGVTVALDDFGAGQADLRHLRDFDFDILKISGEFIRGLHGNPDNRILTQALVGIARQFDTVTVAESVETARDAALLADIGVDCMQGFFFGVPTTRPVWFAFQEESRQAG